MSLKIGVGSLSGVVVCAMLMAWLSLPANAAPGDRWATWAPISGSANDYKTTMKQRVAGFPEASVTSDSRGDIQVYSGTSSYLNADTPPGRKYGSSRNEPYLMLRPKADNATSPSTTTYTFDQPTPEKGWAFVLGDIDSDRVRVSASDAAGDPVGAATIDSWFRGSFNYRGESDKPSWNPTTSMLTGNPDAQDSDGASGWFEPKVPLSSLTLTFLGRAGFPVYQTWFVSRGRPIGGVVTDVSTEGSCAVADSTLTLVSPYGEELATTHPDSKGAYSFGRFALQPGYTVRLEPPKACAAKGLTERQVSNVGRPGSPESRADFEVRASLPYSISGTVVDGQKNPVAGVKVTLTPPTGDPVTTNTDAKGHYLFDGNAVGDGYVVSIDPPRGYQPGPDGAQSDAFSVQTGPVVVPGFVIAALPNVSGVVTGGGEGLGGVQVTLKPDVAGPAHKAVTRGDGSYVIRGVPDGTYTLIVDPPAGYFGKHRRSVIVAGASLQDVNLKLRRPGAIGGTVTGQADGAPRSGVGITVSGRGGARKLTTNAAGGYFVGALRPGKYTIQVAPADGSTVVGAAEQTVKIPKRGEIFGSQDFTLSQASASVTISPSSSPSLSTSTSPGASTSPTSTTSYTYSYSPTSTPTSSPTSDPGSDLPNTGGPQLRWAIGGLACLLIGMVLLGLERARKRRAG